VAAFPASLVLRQADTVTTRVFALAGFHTVEHQTSTFPTGVGTEDPGPEPKQNDGGLALSVSGLAAVVPTRGV
jgi:hypothetical protein